MFHIKLESSKVKHYKFMLLKGYFEKGYALTSYFKYLIALIGFADIYINKSIFWVIFLGITYGVSCFILGWIWYNKGYVDAENEVNNRFNPFVKEVREMSGIRLTEKLK
jgi:hypothetical protein